MTMFEKHLVGREFVMWVAVCRLAADKNQQNCCADYQATWLLASVSQPRLHQNSGLLVHNILKAQ